MNQEFEQRVNQIILEQNVLPSEAAGIAQKQLADEEVKKKENGDESTDSDSSDGTFEYIDKPQFPLTQWQKEQLEATPEWEEDILNTRFTAKDQEEADALNAEYQLDVERYNQERQRELGKLVNNLSFVSDEGAGASLVNDFAGQTGIEIDEELSSLIYEEAENQRSRREAFEKSESEARATAQEQQDFVHLRSFYEGNGVPEEEIVKIETQFNTDLLIQDAYGFSRNPEEFSQRLDSLFLDIEGQATTDSQKAEIQKRKSDIINDYTESYNERGEGLMADTRSGVREMSKRRSDLQKEIDKIIREEGEDVVSMYRRGETEFLQTPGLIEKLERMEYMEMQVGQLSSSIETSRGANKTLRDLFRKYPEAEAVLPLIASAHRSMIGVMEPDVREEYYDHKITRDEALRQSFILQQLRAEAEGRASRYGDLAVDNTVILGAAEVYTTTKESKDVYGDVAYTDAFGGKGTYEENLSDQFVDEQNRILREYYKDLLPEMVKNMTEEEKEDFEKAIMSFTGMPLDISGDDWVGGGSHLNGLKFFGGLWDLGGVLFQQAPAQLGRWLDYEMSMLTADSDEERLAIEKRDSERADVIEYQGNWGGMEWANSFGAVADEGKGTWDSFSEGNWSSGFTKLGNMVFEMAPATVVAMGASVLSGGSAAPGFLLFYTNSMVSTYNYARDLDWYKDKSPLWRGLFLNGTALLESITESIGTKAQLRILGPGKARGLGQTRVSYMGQKIGNQFVETGIETSSELTNTLASGFLEESMGGEGTTTGEVFETILGAGALSTTTASVGAAKRQASAILSNNSIETIGLADYYRREIDLLINETEPNSQARNLRLSSIFEEMNSLAALNADTYELHEYIAGVDEASSQKLVENSVKTFSAIKALEDQNLSRKEREALNLQVEGLAKERLDIEQKHLRSFSLATAQLESGRNIENLNERARIFEAQSESLRKAGKEAQADSMLERAKRVRDRVETLELVTEVENALKANEVISSEDKDPKQIADMLEGQSAVLVDKALAEEMQKRGWSEATFKGSQEGKVLIIKGDNITLGQDDLTFEQARREVTIKQNLNESQDLVQRDENVASVLGRSLREVGNIENLTAYEQELYNSLSEEAKSRTEEIAQRREEDLLVPLDEAIVESDSSILTEEAKSTFDNLSGKFKQILGDGLSISVVKESVAFAQARKRLTDALSEARSDAQKSKIGQEIENLTNDYLSGRRVIGGQYSNGQIVVTDKATSKDIVEELAHAFIANQFVGTSKPEAAFKKALGSILKKDPTLKQHIASKESYYKQLGYKGARLQEELLVEAIARMATSNPSSFLQSTINSVTSLISKYVPGFDVDGDVFSVFNKLATTLASDSSTAEAIKTAFEAAIPADQRKAASDIESAQTESEAQAVQDSTRRPTFLDEKVITYDTLSLNKFTGHARVTGTRQVKVNDYYHFVNWYRKMTGNGQFTRIGMMRYVDENGNTKTLNAPKPRLNADGNPIYMEPAMKSYEQRMIDENTRKSKEREERRMRGVLAGNEIVRIASRIQPIVSAAAEAQGRREIPTGNVTRMIEELMSDFTLDGTPNEAILDENGQPTLEKVIGSEEYYTELQERVNEWVTDNYDSGSVFYSSRQLEDLLNSDLDAESKKKNFRSVYDIAKPLLPPRTQEEIELFIDSNISKLPPLFAQQVFHAYFTSMAMSEFSLEITSGNRQKLTKKDMEKMAQVSAMELDFVNTFLGDRAKRFYKVFAETGLSTQDENGNWTDGYGTVQASLSLDENGNWVQSEEKLKLARDHQDLFVALIGVLSNGNRAVPNLTEATKLYNVILEDILQTGQIGERTTARLSEIENSNIITGVKTNRPKEIVTGLRVLLGLQENKKSGNPYDFQDPTAFKKAFLEKDGKGGIAGQSAYGSWNKIGPS
jgi:hypothetical protein